MQFVLSLAFSQFHPEKSLGEQDPNRGDSPEAESNEQTSAQKPFSADKQATNMANTGKTPSQAGKFCAPRASDAEGHPAGTFSPRPANDD